MGNDDIATGMTDMLLLPLSLQREEACGVFSEALAELELSEREASRQREEEEASQQLQETYRVGVVWRSSEPSSLISLGDCRQAMWMGYRVLCCLRLCWQRTLMQRGLLSYQTWQPC